MKASLRYVAAQLIAAVLQGQSLAETLPQQLQKIANPQDRAFLQHMVFGVCRFYTRLDFYLKQLLKKPLKANQHLVKALLLVGLYQLTEMRVPAHAAVAETVAAAYQLRQPWAVGLINAILREFLRQQAPLLAAVEMDEMAKYAHPAWWLTRIKKEWSHAWQTILLANNTQAPLVLRINTHKISRARYLELLATASIAHEVFPQHPQAIYLPEAIAVEKLPGFSEGWFVVQDAAAQFAAYLLQLEKAQRVLDACAAPGGKLLHLIEVEPTLKEVVAVEKENRRMRLIKENMMRLQPHVPIHLLIADATQPEKWWDGQLFERILLDAPCSASGVIRKHPDIKLLRQARDITPLAHLQLQLLTKLWPLLKPNGILLYVTCSIFAEENSDVIRAFLEQEPLARELPITEDLGINCAHGTQILPSTLSDGFYYARLQKLTSQ